jgi:hypothetical protein
MWVAAPAAAGERDQKNDAAAEKLPLHCGKYGAPAAFSLASSRPQPVEILTTGWGFNVAGQ